MLWVMMGQVNEELKRICDPGYPSVRGWRRAPEPAERVIAKSRVFYGCYTAVP